MSQTDPTIGQQGADGTSRSTILDLAEFDPVFIVGFPRSGTTLLAVMMDRHPLVAIGPESHFIEVAENIDLPDRTDQPETWINRLLAAPRLCDLGLRSEWVLSKLPTHRAVRAPEMFAAILLAYTADRGKSMAGEKTPTHLLHLPMLLDWFPKARALCVQRDGRDAVASLLQVPWRNHSSVRIYALQWEKFMHRMETAMQMFPDRVMPVRYENLVQNPEKTLREIDHFIGVDFDPAQLNVTRPTETVPQWETRWKATATADRPNAEHLGLWRTRLSPPEKVTIQGTIYHSLRSGGYLSPEEQSFFKSIRHRFNCNLLLRHGFFRKIYLKFIRHSQTYKHREHAFPREKQ